MTSNIECAVDIGWDNEQIGTIACTPDGLQVHAETDAQREELRGLIAELRPEGMSDADFVRSLPGQLHSRMWASPLIGFDTMTGGA